MNYIADFYCAKAKLVIELDGSQHYTDDGITRDQAREELLKILDIEVLRFSNHEIDKNFSDVCQSIEKTVIERMGRNAPP